MPTPTSHAALPQTSERIDAPVIDLRSDTVTRPTQAMRNAIASAEVGDDVLGDDPTVLRLQVRIAKIMGTEAACFVPSGTMANQTAIRAHTEPGDEVIAHEDSHIIHYETGGPAALAGVMIRPLRGESGFFQPADIDAAVRPKNSHYPNSALVILENTHNRGGGSIWPIDQLADVCDRARHHGLKLHLDGARIWNAVAATGLPASAYAKHFDSISCCFSKGLGSPAGSAVCGSHALIARVHRFRKMFGGSMRQSGMLAAAALHALDHHVARLSDDHANAKTLAEGLSRLPGIRVPNTIQTNMVFLDIDSSLGTAAEFCDRMKPLGVWMLPNAPQRVRAVCHLDVTSAMIEQAIARISRSLARVPV